MAVKWIMRSTKRKNLLHTKSKTGSGPTRFAFFDRMDEFLDTKANISIPHWIETKNINSHIVETATWNNEILSDISNIEENDQTGTNKHEPQTSESTTVNQGSRNRKNMKTEYYKLKTSIIHSRDEKDAEKSSIIRKK